MKRYALLHYGFETPTPEIMAAWGKWFESIAGRNPENVGAFGAAKEITKSGTKDLPMGLDSLTGFSVIDAENMADAESVAKSCPSITRIRVYEIMSMEGH